YAVFRMKMKSMKTSSKTPQQEIPGQYVSDEKRWNAVVHRDAKADGKFYYSVKTTGVYCRPSCAARLPLRKNVAFHDSSEEAEQEGFRACKRCQPNGRALVEEYAVKVSAVCRT